MPASKQQVQAQVTKDLNTAKKKNKDVSNSSKKSSKGSETDDNESIDPMDIIDQYDETVDFLVNELEQKKKDLYTYKNKATRFEKYAKNGDEYIDKLLQDIDRISKQLAFQQNEKNKTKNLNKKGIITLKQNMNNKILAAKNDLPEDIKLTLREADDKILDEMEKKRIERIYNASAMYSHENNNFKYLGEQIRNMNKDEIRYLAEVADKAKPKKQ